MLRLIALFVIPFKPFAPVHNAYRFLKMIIACSYLWVIGFGGYLIGQNQLQIGQFVAAVLMANLLVFRIESIGQVLHIFCRCTFIGNSNMANAR